MVCRAPITSVRELRRPPHTEEIKPQSETGVFLWKTQAQGKRSQIAFEGLSEFLKGTLQALHRSFF